jgi:hypothetical protein
MRFFTVTELAAAFALLVSSAKADALAKQWFETFADSVDADGYYVHDGPWREKRTDQPVPTQLEPDWNTPAAIADDEALFKDFSDDSASAYLLRLGNLQLALVAAVDDTLFERMRVVRGMSGEGADRNRLQIRRGLDAYHRRVRREKGE